MIGLDQYGPTSTATLADILGQFGDRFPADSRPMRVLRGDTAGDGVKVPPLDVHDLTVTQEVLASAHEQTGWRSSRSVEVRVARATWTVDSWTGRREPDGVTIMEIVEGGLTGGEGDAFLTLYAWDTNLGDAEARAAAGLAVRDMLTPANIGQPL